MAPSSRAAEVVEYWRSRKGLIDARIERLVAEDREAETVEVKKYIVMGGKRFRGVLTMLVCEALGGEAEDALDAATAIELVHAASLSLDDIIDGDVFRRGRLAAWVAYGVSKTVLVSNMLVPMAQLLVSRYGFKALIHVIRTWEEMTRGEILDAFIRWPATSPTLYLRIADLKTGSLFRLAAVLGGIAAGREGEELRVVGEYGSKLGIAYQLADDLADLSRASRDGLAELPPSIKLMVSWLSGKGSLTEECLEEVISNGLLKLREVVSRAEDLVASIGAVRYESVLKHVPRFMVEKMLEEAGLSLE